jgi:hypothetical protein
MLLEPVLFTLTALGGAVLASFPLRGIPRPPTWLALGHGGIAIVSFGALIYRAATTGVPSIALVALGLFALAAIGGAVLFLGFHLSGKPLPKALVLGHGALGAIGVVLLWIGAYG